MEGLLRSWGLSIDSTRTGNQWLPEREGARLRRRGGGVGAGKPGRETRPTGGRFGREVGACGAGAAGSEIQPYLEGGIEEAALSGGRRVAVGSSGAPGRETRPTGGGLQGYAVGWVVCCRRGALTGRLLVLRQQVVLMFGLNIRPFSRNQSGDCDHVGVNRA